MSEPTLVPMPTVHATRGMVASADALATQAGVATLRRAARPSMRRSPPTPSWRSPRRTCAAWAATCSPSSTPAPAPPGGPQRRRPGRLGRRPRPPAGRRPRASMPFRDDIRARHRARLRRRLAGAARPLRAAAAGRRAGAGDRLRRATGFPASPLLVGSAQRPALTAAGGRAGLRRPHPVRPAGRGVRVRPGRCGRSPPTAAPASTAATSARGLLALGRRRVRRDADLATPAGRLGRAAPASRVWGHDVWTIPPPLAGLPDPRRRRGSPPAWPCPTTRTTRLGAPRSWPRRSPPATTASDVLLRDGADGPALLAARAPRVLAADAASHATGLAGSADRRRAGRRHHLPVRRRRRRHGRVAHPVERLGLRQPPLRAVHGHQPPQPRPRLLARARPPGRVRRRAPAAPHAVARRSSPRPTAGWRGARHPGRRRPAPDPAAGAGPAARARASRRPRPSAARAGC